MKRILTHLDWGDIGLGIIALIALVLGVLDFTPLVQLTNDPALQMVLSGIGLILGAVVIQSTRRKAEISELRQAVGQAEVVLLNMRTDFPDHIAQHARRARKFILDTNLSNEVPRVGTSSPQDLYRQIRHDKLIKAQINFLQVVSIFHRGTLESVIEKLIAYKDKEYYVRHYQPPPKAIPILHIMSFDNEHFYVGGFHPAESLGEETAVYIRHPLVNQLLSEYWNVLWGNAIPLKEGKMIYLDRLWQIAERIGVTRAEFDEMVKPLNKGAG
ncbi:MAG: hypothetical protein ACOYYF_04400 [Chloroflexota bacterium]|nr:hypothetical protein [Chloroflexota bacterium]MBI5701913.1 hypothetical protein [Chloroflexota bacterium]